MNLLGAFTPAYGDGGDPNVTNDAGFQNDVPPPPGPGDREVDMPSYSQQPVSRGPVGSMFVPGALTRVMPAAHNGLRGALLGIAGAAIASWGRSSKQPTWFWARAGLAGIAVCWIVSRKTEGMPCTLAACVGGYAAAKLVK